MRFLFLCLLVILSFTTPPTFGNTLTGATIHDRIVVALSQKGIKASPSIGFERLFPACPSKLLIESIFGSWKTVKVYCPENKWKIVVRTNAGNSYSPVKKNPSNNSNDQKPIVVLKTSLNKGDIIKFEHLEYAPTETNIGGGVFHDTSFLKGRQLKTALSVGTVLRARHLVPDWVIKKDQPVTIEHRVGNILINTKGIAQESAQLGEKIWVINFNSGKKVLCWVKNDKKVSTNSKVF